MPEISFLFGTNHQDTSHVREVLTQAVREQMMSDVPIGLLLSGGLDSAVISTIIKPMLEETKQQFITFTVGQEGSPDITAARMMSEHLGTDHHEYLFTSEEACSIIPDVVYHLETYEPELIRSAIPNYFLARLASKYVKVVLTGEGSGEGAAAPIISQQSKNPSIYCLNLYNP